MSPETKTVVISRSELADAFYCSTDSHTDLTAFKADGGLGRKYTYGEVGRTVRAVAAGLCSNRLNEIAEIGIIAENRPEWGMAYFAILDAGCTVVPIDANLKSNEIAHVIGHSGLEVVFASEKFVPILKDIGSNLTIISFDGDDENDWPGLASTEVEELPRDPNDTAVLIYTSGTTGKPKAVELTQRNLMANFEGIREAFDFGPDDNYFSVLPLHHTFEATVGLIMPLLSGLTIVYSRSLKSKEIIEDIRHNEITVMAGVPLLYEKIYQSFLRGIAAAPLQRRLAFKMFFNISRTGWKLGQRWGRTIFSSLREKSGLGSVRMFVSGGAAIPPRIAAFYNYIGFDFFQGYGMTECSPVITSNRLDNITFGACGKPLYNVEIKINEPDKEGVGEILVRGDNVTPGYRGNPEETAVLIRDGWLWTGDLGCIVKGHLWITGRRKNIIVSAAGKNIYPEELEEKLLDSVLVLEAIAFGRPKENRQGEEVRAVIVPDLDELKREHGVDPNGPNMTKVRDILAAEVDRVNQSLSDYKRIAAFDLQLAELEKTSTKKVKRTVYK